MSDFRERIREYQDEYLADLARLVAIPSVRDPDTARPLAPFGEGIRRAFDCFLEIGEKCGLRGEDFDGFACHLTWGDSGEYAGVLGHLDVVGIQRPEEWKTPPFTMIRSPDGMLYGRGVNDDKGPLLAGLYALRILKDLGVPLKRSVRIIAGGAEETTWECMDHYFAQNPQPVMGFSPDGNFPVVNGEKGIIKFDFTFPRGPEPPGGGWRVTDIRCGTLRNFVCGRVEVDCELDGGKQTLSFSGREALSRNPQRGDNALWKFAARFSGQRLAQPELERLLRFMNERLTDDWYGEKSGLYAADRQMGSTSLCATGVRMEEDGVHLYLDVRYPRAISGEDVRAWAGRQAGAYGFTWRVEDEKRLLYVPEDSELIVSLKSAYEKVTGERAAVLSKGGASYARTLEHGVAFGAAFENEETFPHMPNERMSCASLLKAMEIYCEALWNLAAEDSHILPH